MTHWFLSDSTVVCLYHTRATLHNNSMTHWFHTIFVDYSGCWTRQPGRTSILGSRRVLVLIQNTCFVQINGTNQTKEGYKGGNPASKKLLVRLVWHYSSMSWLDKGHFIIHSTISTYYCLGETYCNTLQHASVSWLDKGHFIIHSTISTYYCLGETYCNTLQHASISWLDKGHSTIHSTISTYLCLGETYCLYDILLQHTAMHCTATQCNTLQHASMSWRRYVITL